ncbi:dimethyl sulfoxide reductase anchor subunit family protein [endosymbiont of unidentified scaly snail isolate Monju]|uniref:dimethyl sulfoxide reductase anchor subunit family protein n=1 Tax=endosymbiont of unidentified scaly snail isolate Monju TaxID=1248727 RepID=UPI0003891BCF|nr:DmsC/YnfH family molybdoenzyme membrane anchor subunit [endosymbiont of unidentified scaly snail isolate Monju]BAN68843.1 molybdopterin oxidoreductase, anchor subunit [endosymbiont of unidentified scaly snail isolate Monju]
MHPAFSVIFLTTLIGAAQGMFMALVTGQVYSMANLLEPQDSVTFYAAGSLIALLLLGGGLVAAVFHLGKPSYFITRAWRGVTQWRTSWLSRELIALPAFMFLVFLYGVVHYMGWTDTLFTIKGVIPVDLSLIIGTLGVLMAITLFISTAMIYASLRFLQEWHSPLTVVNFILFGMASGFTLTAAFSAWTGVDLVGFYGTWAVLFTIMAFVTRFWSMLRNQRIKHKSDMRSALGIRHTKITQRSMGFMGGSFNTKEYFHGKSGAFVEAVRLFFLVMVFAVPVALLAASNALESRCLPALAFLAQYIGLLAERWYFFAEAKHPQNLYYQTVG